LKKSKIAFIPVLVMLVFAAFAAPTPASAIETSDPCELVAQYPACQWCFTMCWMQIMMEEHNSDVARWGWDR
jgi:hypothetical protein